MQNGGRIRSDSVRLKDGGNVVPIRDGLISLVSGMGTGTDPRSYLHYTARTFTDQEIDAAYRGSWVIRKAIDKPATEMVREWRDWQADADDIEKLEAEEKRLDLRNQVKRGEVMRGLGGGGMVLYAGGNPDEQEKPLNPAAIRSGGLQRIHVWHRSRFTLGPMIEDWTDPWFGHPSYYEVQLASTTARAIRFHPSRVVAFKGEQVPGIAGAMWQEAFWGQSRVQIILDAAKNVDTADNGFAALIKDARNRRIYIPRLLEMIATAAGEAQLAKRLQAFAIGESSNSVSWLDGGDGDGKGAEKIDDRQMTWAGMPDIMNAYRVAMAAAADMPATVLWGTSPQGMNATGDSDIELWHKTIRGKQDLDLRPCMTQIDAALIPSALGKVDDDIWYEWAPLSSQSEKDEATTFWNFMQGLTILETTKLVPTIALEKAVQNLLEERGWMPGIGDALAKLPEDERFPSLAEPDPNEADPSDLTQAEGGDPASAGKGVQPAARRRAANDAMTALGLDETVRAAILDALEVGDKPSLPFDDAYDPAQARDPRGRWTSAAAFVEAVLADKTNKKGQHRLGKIPAHVHERFSKLGIHRRPLSVALEHDRVLHNDHRHGRDSRGQKPIEPGDYALAHRILSRGTINYGNPPMKNGHPQVFARASIKGHTYDAAYELRKYRAVLISLRKR